MDEHATGELRSKITALDSAQVRLSTSLLFIEKFIIRGVHQIKQVNADFSDRNSNFGAPKRVNYLFVISK